MIQDKLTLNPSLLSDDNLAILGAFCERYYTPKDEWRPFGLWLLGVAQREIHRRETVDENPREIDLCVMNPRGWSDAQMAVAASAALFGIDAMAPTADDPEGFPDTGPLLHWFRSIARLATGVLLVRLNKAH